MIPTAMLAAVFLVGVFGGGAGAAVRVDVGAASPRKTRVAGECSEATAQALARKYKLGDQTYDYPVGQVLCGPFTGAGSDAVAFSFHYPGCVATSGFAVFRFNGGDWQLVLRNADSFISLSQVGSDVVEKVSVFRRGDPRCVPSGGTKERLWHWDGQQLVPSAWKQLTQPKAPTSLDFLVPRGAIANASCSMVDEPTLHRVECGTDKPPHRVDMNGNGVVRACRGWQPCVSCGCRPPGARVLASGHQVEVGRFRCESLHTGVRCTVIKTGKGFLFTRTSTVRVR